MSIRTLLGNSIPNDIASYIVLCITKSFVYSYSSWPDCTCLCKCQMGYCCAAYYSTDTRPIPTTCTQYSNPTDLSTLDETFKIVSKLPHCNCNM